MSSEVVNPKPAESMALEPARPAAVRQAIPVQFNPNDPVALYMNTGVFEQLQRVAKLMSSSELVPAHLRDKQADCFLVAAQAFRWGMDPFSVAQHTFVTQGKLGYEGKLIAALINASGKLLENLLPVYEGEKGTDRRKVTIVGKLTDGKDRTVEGTVGDWKTKNEKWAQMPDQMLFYRGAREWARRHMPEVVLGIQADEEIEPPAPSGPRPRSIESLTERLESSVSPTREPQPSPEPPPAAVIPATATPAAEAKPAPAPEAKPEPKACEHTAVPAARLKGVPKGKSVACPDCGEELPGTLELPDRVQGEDDGDETPSTAAPAATTAAAKGGRPKQTTLTEQ